MSFQEKLLTGPKSRYARGKKCAAAEEDGACRPPLMLLPSCLAVCAARRHDAQLVKETTHGAKEEPVLIPVKKQILLLVCILWCLPCAQAGEEQKKPPAGRRGGGRLSTRQIGNRAEQQPWRPGFISACHEKPRQFSVCIPAVLRHSGISGRKFPSTHPLFSFFFFFSASLPSSWR